MKSEWNDNPDQSKISCFVFVFGVNFGTLLTDSLKAFDCISHKLTYLQNYMRMVLAWEHSDWYIVTLVKENKEQE